MKYVGSFKCSNNFDKLKLPLESSGGPEQHQHHSMSGERNELERPFYYILWPLAASVERDTQKTRDAL